MEDFYVKDRHRSNSYYDFSKISKCSISSKSGSNQNAERHQKGRADSRIPSYITSQILGPAIGDALIETAECAGSLLNFGGAGHRRGGRGCEDTTSPGRRGRASTSNELEQWKSGASSDMPRGVRSAAVDQLRMLFSPRLDNVIIETAAICCCCCRSKMAERLERDVREWKRELAEKRERERKASAEMQRCREEDEGGGRELEESQARKGDERRRRKCADADGRHSRGDTARRPSNVARSSRPCQKSKVTSEEMHTQYLPDEPQEDDFGTAAKTKCRKKPRAVPTEPTAEAPQQLNKGVQMSENEILLAQIDYAKRMVSTADKISQTDEQVIFTPPAMIKQEPETENYEKNWYGGAASRCPNEKRPPQVKEESDACDRSGNAPGVEGDVARAMTLSKDLIDTIALQARAIGGVLELRNSLLPKENTSASETYAQETSAPRNRHRKPSRRRISRDPMKESKSFDRCGSMRDQTGSRSIRRKSSLTGSTRYENDYPCDNLVQGRSSSMRSRNSENGRSPHSISQAKQALAGKGVGSEDQHLDCPKEGGTPASRHMGLQEEEPSCSSSMNHSSFVNERHFTDNESCNREAYGANSSKLSEEKPPKYPIRGKSKSSDTADRADSYGYSEESCKQSRESQCICGSSFSNASQGEKLPTGSGVTLVEELISATERSGEISKCDSSSVRRQSRTESISNEECEKERQNSIAGISSEAKRVPEDYCQLIQEGSSQMTSHPSNAVDQSDDRKTLETQSGIDKSRRIQGQEETESQVKKPFEFENSSSGGPKDSVIRERPTPTSTCFEPRCSDAGLTRRDDYMTSERPTSKRERNLIEVEEIPSLDGKTAKVITRKETVTEEKDLDVRDETPDDKEGTIGGVVTKADPCESAFVATGTPPEHRSGFLNGFKRRSGYKRSKKTCEVAVTPEGTHSTTVEEEEKVETKPAQACLGEGATAQEAPTIGDVWDVESGEKLPGDSSQTSLRFPVRDDRGCVVGVREVDLPPASPSQGEPRDKRASRRCRKDKRDAGGGRKSAPRTLWAIARINEFGGGERTLEIVETDERRPETHGKAPEFGKEVFVFVPPSKKRAESAPTLWDETKLH